MYPDIHCAEPASFTVRTVVVSTPSTFLQIPEGDNQAARVIVIDSSSTMNQVTKAAGTNYFSASVPKCKLQGLCHQTGVGGGGGHKPALLRVAVMDWDLVGSNLTFHVRPHSCSR